MCGRYNVNNIQLAQAELEVTYEFKPNYNAAPTQKLPIITDAASHLIQGFQWGLIPSWSKEPKPGYSTINARSEEVFTKAMYKGPVRKKRCLVLANGYFEWLRLDAKAKVPYLISATDQPLMTFAGIWDVWENKESGEKIFSFSILTVSPPARIAHIHDRMPVILKEEDKGKWLKEGLSDEEIKALFLTYPEAKLKAHPVSQDVGNVKNNSPELILPCGDCI